MLNISIITASRNAAATIACCLDSVAGQKNVLVQHIVVDGASSDGTSDILRERSSRIHALVSEPDKGIYDAMNKGLALAQGEIVGILNADDFYAADTVLHDVCAMFATPEIDACYGDLAYVAAGNAERIVRFWRAGSFRPESFCWGWMPPHPTFFVRRRVYEQYGGFNLELGSAADYEIMLRLLLRHRIKAAYLPKVIVKMRTGGISNASLANRLRANRMDRKAWAVNGLRPYPWTLWLKPLRKIGQWFVRQ